MSLNRIDERIQEPYMSIPVIDKRVHEFHAIACLNRNAFQDAGVFVVSVLGGPGCGKTSLITATMEHFSPEIHVGVIACDIESHRDADRYSSKTRQVVQINTGKGGVVDATHIREALACLDLKAMDLLFIENVGTLALPEISDLGQNATATVFSVAAGDDKADKHPDLVQASDVVLLNKIDLLPAVPFDLKAFRADLDRVKAGIPLIELSSLKKNGIEPWSNWLRSNMTEGHQSERLWFG
jgi:hydrogenase nickel incorporation protein HypB